MTLRVGAWNIEGIIKHLPSLNELLTKIEENVDIMCLSEIKCEVSDTITADNYFEEYALTPSTTDMYTKDRYERIVNQRRQCTTGPPQCSNQICSNSQKP